MKRYLGLESNSLEDVVGLGHLALALIAWLWNLRRDCVCLMANPIRGHDVCNVFKTGRPNRCFLLAIGAGTIFYC